MAFERVCALSEVAEPGALRVELADIDIAVVRQVLAERISDDAAARAAYLAPDVFFYGHKRTRAQASREISLLYRVWPQRKFAPTEDINVFAIPHHPGLYKVTAMLQYDMINPQNQRMSGRSQMTCILEHDRHSIRIVGVGEKLLPQPIKLDSGS